MFHVMLKDGSLISMYDDQQAAIDRAASIKVRAYVIHRIDKTIIYRNW